MPPTLVSCSLVSHSRTVSWCFRGRVKPDLLVLLAQSHASRGLALDALSAQLAVMTFSLSRRSHFLREAFRPLLCLPNLRFNPPAGGGAKHPPAGGGAKHPPAGGGANSFNLMDQTLSQGFKSGGS